MNTTRPTNKPTTRVPLKGVDTPLEWDAWFVLAFLLLAGIVLASNRVPADFVFLFLVALYNLAGIITTAQAVAGFASTGMLTVAILMVVTAAITNTSALGYFMSKVLGHPRTVGSAVTRLIIPVGFLSSFINDTPVFLLFVPIIQSWSQKFKIDPRVLWLPASFTALLGGTVTLIGTSTNLVLYGEVQKKLPGLVINLFDITPVGIPVLLFGLGYIALFAEKLLPHFHKTQQNGLSDSSPAAKVGGGGFDLSSLTLAATVSEKSSVVDQTIEEAGLRRLDNLYIVAVTRDDLTIHAVAPDFHLKSGDVLRFTGSADRFLAVCHDKTLLPVTSDDTSPEISIDDPESSVSTMKKVVDGYVVTVIVTSDSKLVGKSAKDINFRRSFDAAILTFQRNGKSLDPPIGQIPLAIGDTLTLLAGSRFNKDSDQIVQNFKVLEGAASSDAIKYLIGAKVLAKAQVLLVRSLAGSTIDQAGLRTLPGAFLVAVTPKATGQIIRAVPPDYILQVDDICWFTGKSDAVTVVRKIPGLRLLGDFQGRKLKVTSEKRRLVEVVIAPSSPMIGLTLRENRFRTRFGGAVVAIRRGAGADNVIEDIAVTPLLPGDVLMVDAGPEFVERHRFDPNFLLLSELAKTTPPQFAKFYLAMACLLTIFGVFIGTSTKVSLVPLGIMAAAVLLTFRVLTAQQARAAVDWEVLVTIAAASGVSSALEVTGLANAIGYGFVQLSVATGGGQTGVLAGIYIGTMLVSLVVANNAAALIMFTIGLSASIQYGVDIYKMIYIIMLAASASFAIPYGYQTNIMCLSLGPYTFREFAKFGVPLQIFLTPISILVVSYMEQWVYGVVVSIVFFLFCAAVRLTSTRVFPGIKLEEMTNEPKESNLSFALNKV